MSQNKDVIGFSFMTALNFALTWISNSQTSSRGRMFENFRALLGTF